MHIIKGMFFLIVGLFSSLVIGQTVENFEYTSGTLLTDNGYGTKGDAPAVYVSNSGLEYSGLAVSGVGNAAHIEISEDDDGDSSTYGGERIAWREMFSQSVSSGTVYLSFIAKIQSTIGGANMFNNFFIAMSNPDRNKLRGRVMAKDDGTGKVMFGLTKGYSTSVNWTTALYDYDKTYLFVVKYEFLTGGDSDDVASLFIFDAATDGVPVSEPTTANLTANDGSDTPKIKIVHLRQSKVAAIVDGLIMGTSWADVVLRNANTYPQYYIDSVEGDDENEGNSADVPWRTLLNLKSVVLDAGNIVYLKRGSEWNEVFSFKGSGSSGNPILIKPYGSGPRPVIASGGTDAAFLIKNQQYIEVEGLKITNQGATPQKNRKGVYIEAENFGVVNHIHLKDLEITDVNGRHGGLSDGDFQDDKMSGGIIISIVGDLVETYFDDLLIENCHIHQVSQTGISNKSSWDDREWPRNGGSYVNTSWVGSKNVVYRNNRLEHIAGNGIIIREAHAPLLEYNKLDYCGELTTGNAAFCFNTDYALFQYNEVSNTITNPGDVDSGGLDSDFKTRWTTFQYNYCHNNGEGGVLITGGPARWDTAFNYKTIIRYNLLADNGDHGIKTSGNVTELKVYNNHIYSGIGESIEFIQHVSWEGYSRDAEYYNNVFNSSQATGSINLGSSSGNSIYSNQFSGVMAHGQVSADNNLWNAPPVYQTSPTSTGGVESFRLAATSPGVDAGSSYQHSAEDGYGGEIPIQDIFGNSVTDNNVDVGMEENGASMSNNPFFNNQVNITVFSSNEGKQLVIKVDNAAHIYFTNVKIYDMRGRLILNEVVGNQKKIVLNTKNKLFKGAYILKMNGDKINFSKKFLVR